MIRYKLSYLTSLFFLFVFTVVFLSVDFFMPHLRDMEIKQNASSVESLPGRINRAGKRLA